MISRVIFPLNHPLFSDYPPDVLARFRSFHRANPHIFDTFVQRAEQMFATGRKRYSARRIVEAMRWDDDLVTTGDVFEINDDYVPIYARFLIYCEPKFTDFFELRRVRSLGIKSQEQRDREDN